MRRHEKPDGDSLPSSRQTCEACEGEMGRKKNNKINEEAKIDEEKK